jgi:hypothetical protein
MTVFRRRDGSYNAALGAQRRKGTEEEMYYYNGMTITWRRNRLSIKINSIRNSVTCSKKAHPDLLAEACREVT